MIMWSEDPNPRSSQPKLGIPVDNFDVYFSTPGKIQSGRVVSLSFADADKLSDLWKEKYNLSPRLLFDFHANDGGGLVLKINNLTILDDFDYGNFVIQFQGWSKILKVDEGSFDTGEPGNSVVFHKNSRGGLDFELYQNFRWGDNSWVFADMKAFRVALMYAYADVAKWVRAADPVYYEELLKNGTLPVPAPDSELSW